VVRQAQGQHLNIPQYDLLPTDREYSDVTHILVDDVDISVQQTP